MTHGGRVQVANEVGHVPWTREKRAELTNHNGLIGSIYGGRTVRDILDVTSCNIIMLSEQNGRFQVIKMVRGDLENETILRATNLLSAEIIMHAILHGKTGFSRLVAHNIQEEKIERQITQAMTLENRVRIEQKLSGFEFDDASSGAYIVLEHYDGVNADEWSTGGIPYLLRLEAFERFCGLIETMHGEGILHLDITPKNLMVNIDTLGLMVLDFGNAKTPGVRHYWDNARVGTPGFAAPEQCDQKGERGAWTDVFGAGATGYHMITGKVPNGLTSLDYHDFPIVIGNVPYEVRPLAIEYGTVISDILRKAVSKNPQRRYQEMEKMRSEVSQLRQRLFIETKKTEVTLW